MIGLLVEETAIGVNEILGAFNVRMLKGGNHVYILEPTVEYGNRYTLAFVPNTVQVVPSQHLKLFLAIAIGDSFDAVPGIKRAMTILLYHF